MGQHTSLKHCALLYIILDLFKKDSALAFKVSLYILSGFPSNIQTYTSI